MWVLKKARKGNAYKFHTTESIFRTETELMSKSLDLHTENGQSFLGNVAWRIDRLQGRNRRFYAEVKIPHSQEQIWQVLTNYEALPEFIINFQQIQRLDHPTGNIRIEKIMTKKFMGMEFQARMVSDMEEHYPHEVCEKLVEGDFQSYCGYWRLNPWVQSDGKVGVNLVYDLLVCPKRIYPLPLFEHILSKDLPNDILAVCHRAELLFGRNS
ncbi:Streptomyces cyclase/dehydrase [Cylindrospermum sp. NIES-4074]|nr:Streptomyces cyclase/dehydrase [Cylindrospermum sp. NIES-4074]